MTHLRRILVILSAFLTLLSGQAIAASLQVSWNANTDADLAGYKVYYGTLTGTYGPAVDVRNVTAYQIANVQSGSTYYVAVSAYDSSGNESSRSTEVRATIPAADTTPPTGTVTINSGGASTTSASVTLTLSAADAGGTVTGMRISNDGVNYGSEIAYASTRQWTLSTGYGTKTVYVLFKDASGNWTTSPATDTIQYLSPTTSDTTPPTGTVTINSGGASTTSASVTLTLSAADAGGTVTGMKISNDGVNYGSEIAYASTRQWTLSTGYGTKTVYVLFKDAAGNWMTSPATDTIQYVSSAVPVANAGAAQNVPPQRVILDGSLSRDPNNGTLSYSWAQVSGPVQVLLETPTSSVASFMGIKAGLYRFRLTCTNAAGTSTATVDVTIQNVAPSVNAGSDTTVNTGTPVTLHATGSDPNEDQLTYQWAKVSGPSVTLPSLAQQNIAFTPSAAGLYTFSVRSSDGVNTSAADQVNVTVNAANRAPTANAGPDMDVAKGSQVSLNGTGSTDPDGNTLRYSWVQASGTQVSLTGAQTAQPTFVASTVGTLEFDLTVSDGIVSSTPDRVVVRVVSQNTAPVAVAGPDMHAFVGDDVVLDASGSYDPDGNPITFSWTQVSGASVVIVNPKMSQAFFTPTTSGVFELRVTVSDGQASATDTVTVTVDNANQVPIADAGTNQVVVSGATVTLNGSASSDPDGNPISYLWSQTSGTRVSLSSSNTARPTFVATDPGVYVFELKVYDGTDTSSASSVTVTVQSKTAEITLVSPAMGASVSTSPKLTWAGVGFSRYRVYISVNGGAKYQSVYSGSGTSCTLNSLLWNWFIPAGTTVTWYVEGTAGTRVVKSSVGTFIKR